MSNRILTAIETTYIERVNQAVEADDLALVDQLAAEFDAELAQLKVA
ncbi:hypothetical protein ACPPVT_12100 [Angustibacter sp. McL0619]